MSSAPSLGPYRILGEIGSGGMGVVYRGYDDRLQREIALKVFALDGRAGRRDRARLFEEARSASSLQHPNIVAVFDVGETMTNVGSEDGEERLVGFIAMEKVEGQTLESMLVSSRLSTRRTLEILIPVADALARAHSAGIVHRDVKPANIMVGLDGRAKVLDFGLARRVSSPSREGAGPSQETLAPPTLDGLVVGTAAYMSPEQASGQKVDFRSDLFSFGSTLYEAVTGRRAFTGASDVDVMHAIIHDEPRAVRTLSPGVPESLAWAIEKCLQKEPDDRYQSTLDLVLDLKHALTEMTRSRPTVVTRPERRALPRRVTLGRAALVAGGAAALGVAAGLFASKKPGVPAPRIEPVAASTGAAWAQGAPSPVGNNVAVTSNLKGSYDIYLVAPGADPVQRTDSPDDEIEPAFSPDGSSLLYTRETAKGDEIWTVPAVGGAPRRVLVEAASASYTPDGKRIVFVRSLPSAKEALCVALADGSDVRTVVEMKGSRLSSPRVSPDGKDVAFLRIPLVHSDVNVYTVPLAGGTARALTKESDPFAHGLGTNGCDFSADGREIYFSSTRSGAWNLWAVPFRGGSPRRLTVGIGPDVYPRSVGGGSFLFEVYRERWSIWGVKLGSDLTPVDAPHLLTQDGGAWAPTLSPDGKKLAYCTFPHEDERHVWVVDLATKARIRISNAGRRNANPSFSPDGTKVVWFGDAAGTYDLWMAPAEGGPATRLTDFPDQELRPFFFPDGNRIVFSRVHENEEPAVWVLDLSTKKARAITPKAFYEPRPSADGKWVVCAGDREGGANHGVWVVPADGSAAPRLVTDRGYRPVMTPDGKGILFLTTDPGFCRVWLVPFDGGTPREIFKIPGYRNYLQIDLSKDGRYLVYNTIDSESSVWRWRPES